MLPERRAVIREVCSCVCEMWQGEDRLQMDLHHGIRRRSRHAGNCTSMQMFDVTFQSIAGSTISRSNKRRPCHSFSLMASNRLSVEIKQSTSLARSNESAEKKREYVTYFANLVRASHSWCSSRSRDADPVSLGRETEQGERREMATGNGNPCLPSRVPVTGAIGMNMITALWVHDCGPSLISNDGFNTRSCSHS